MIYCDSWLFMFLCEYFANIVLMCKVFIGAVCSRTLWVGHISKQTTEEELQLELSKHGEATVRVSIVMCLSDCYL